MVGPVLVVGEVVLDGAVLVVGEVSVEFDDLQPEFEFMSGVPSVMEVFQASPEVALLYISALLSLIRPLPLPSLWKSNRSVEAKGECCPF